MPPTSAAVLARLAALHPKVIDLSLDRILRLLDRLGRPQDALPPVVHVAGTNGKGSVVAFLRAILEAAGLRLHVYTSPHLVRFGERIVVAGREIDEPALTALLEECERVDGGAPITFFEITTAAALLAFARAPADATLLEVGLGGRLDATNVVDAPMLTAITPVSLDHQAFLGDTIAAIAGEKAGILKPGVVCVCAAQEPAARAVIRARAEAVGAPLLEAGDVWSVDVAADGGLEYRDATRALSLPPPSLPGRHQYGNAGQAVACALRLPFPVTEAAIARGLAGARWPARLQRLDAGRLRRLLPDGWELWLDGGHNAGAGEALGRHALGWRDRPLHLVYGMLRSKDADGFLRPLAPVIDRLVAVPIAGHDCLTPEETVEAAARLGVAAVPAASVVAALHRLAVDAGPPARVLVCGSLYLAGTVLAEDADGA